MVQIFKPGKSKSKNSNHKLEVEIESLDHEGTGVCRQHKPVIFVEGALPGELCQIQVTEKKSRYWRARTSGVIKAHPQRIEAFCRFFQQCGGCNSQHLGAAELLEYKQQALSELLKRVGQQRELPWQQAIASRAQGYRRKARLAVDGQDPRRVKLGFRSAKGKQIQNIDNCSVLTPALQQLLPELNAVFQTLKQTKNIGHVVLLDVLPKPAVLIRQVKALPAADIKGLVDLCQRVDCRLILETARNEFQLVVGDAIESYYSLDDGINLSFLPGDFIQGNETVNLQMVTQAIQWLDLKSRDKVLDLFCGIGNFSLAMALHCESVLGIEGVDDMVRRATDNAWVNNINNVSFQQMDLNQDKSLSDTELANCNKVLLDPARAGALEVMPQLLKLKPEAILYVSCNPATFARDSALLTEKHYRLEKIAMLDMFPATSHTELMALFLPV